MPADTPAPADGATPNAPTPKAATPHAPNHVVATWQGDLRFEAGRPGKPMATIDGNTVAGQSPVDTLLTALATCSASDVVLMLQKRRTPPATLVVDVEATRAAGVPRRVTHFLLRFTIEGNGVEREHTEQFIDLAVGKYCSVRDSLDPSIPIDTVLVLNGETGEVKRMPAPPSLSPPA